jgi:hypothetical protein
VGLSVDPDPPAHTALDIEAHAVVAPFDHARFDGRLAENPVVDHVHRATVDGRLSRQAELIFRALTREQEREWMGFPRLLLWRRAVVQVVLARLSTIHSEQVPQRLRFGRRAAIVVRLP